MTLAIRGDQVSCLSLQLGPRTWLLAVARGFGFVEGVATEFALLTRLRAECARRVRGARFRGAIDRPQAAATAMLAVLARVNGDLYARTASHDDYVTAAASLTAVLVVHGRAYVMHAGATAAYLARDGDVIALSGDDVFDERQMPLLVRALGAAPALDITISSTQLAEGDAIVLLGRRVRGAEDRRALLGYVEANDPGEHVLVARFEHDDAAQRDAPKRPPRLGSLCVTALTRAAAAIAFLIAAVVAH
jgi:hypothetical protein